MDKEVFIFDIDGTLTPARGKMDEEFCKFFRQFVSSRTVYLATGSDYPKVLEQIPLELIYDCMGVFTCMGNELRVNGHIVYTHKLEVPAQVIDWLHLQIKNSKCPPKIKGVKNFEHRAGMINFSTVGRDIINDERELYYQWDKATGERASIVNHFNILFAEYELEAVIGGKISIDIQKKGKGKGQIYDYLSMHQTKIFFGDQCGPGGNDFSLYSLCEKKFHVDSWQHTARIISQNLEIEEMLL